MHLIQQTRVILPSQVGERIQYNATTLRLSNQAIRAAFSVPRVQTTLIFGTVLADGKDLRAWRGRIRCPRYNYMRWLWLS